jgi:uncharacterized protein DUF1353
MRWIAPIVALALALAFRASASESFPCSNCFIGLENGEVKLSENPADPSGTTKILDADLYFIDLEEKAWKAGKGDITDGASIPELFQPIIGGPWKRNYLPAAVMHDHYTNIKHIVRPWWDTDRMFYQAMLVREVGFIKASLMYYAVYIFGPHWGELKPGTPCGPNCTTVRKDKITITYQAADYNLSHVSELNEVKQRITNAVMEGVPLTLSDLESLAAKRHKGNPFLRIRKTNR